MIDNLPTPVAPDSELGRLLSALEAAEAAVMTQRLISTSASGAFRNAVTQRRRLSYLPGRGQHETEKLEAEYQQILELERTRDREGQKLLSAIDEMRQLKERFCRDYQESYRLRTSMDELQRLAS